MKCAICDQRTVWQGRVCKQCYWYLKADLEDLFYAFGWLRECMEKWPQFDTDRAVSGTRDAPAPLRVPYLDHALMIDRLLCQIVHDMGGNRSLSLYTNREYLTSHFDDLVTLVRVGDIAAAVKRVKATAHRLAPWRRGHINLPVPCPSCDLMTLRLYQGDSWVTCRNQHCTEIAIPFYKYDQWVRKLMAKYGLELQLNT